MKYRKFEKGGSDVSLLGFGAMRLPQLPNSDDVDEEEAIRMIRHAIDSGVNYVDTAYVYHGGNSEIIVGKALSDGYREKTLLATKLPLWSCDDEEKIHAIFEEQLRKLGTGHIDMYLMHNINEGNFHKVKSLKIYDILEQKRKEGKIRFIGFSTHPESPKLFKEILDEHPWDFCQLQLNYMDKFVQAGFEGYEYAVAKKVPVVVMEPLKGGSLTGNVPPSVQKCWDSLSPARTPAEWALRWAANLPGVITILSGMSEMGQLEENIRVLSDAEMNSLSASELAVFDKVAEEYDKLIVYPCTGCKYCMPCAAEIDIPEIIGFRNSLPRYGLIKKLLDEYHMWVPHKASDCIACGKCEPHCPQHLEIIKIMKETAELYGA